MPVITHGKPRSDSSSVSSVLTANTYPGHKGVPTCLRPYLVQSSTAEWECVYTSLPLLGKPQEGHRLRRKTVVGRGRANPRVVYNQMLPSTEACFLSSSLSENGDTPYTVDSERALEMMNRAGSAVGSTNSDPHTSLMKCNVTRCSHHYK